MSADLVRRWRRLAREWRGAGASLALRGASVVEKTDCYARADVFRDCADSLERSLAIAKRKAERKIAPYKRPKVTP